MKSLTRLLILLVIAAVGWLGWEAWRAERGRASAIRNMARGALPDARAELRRYLRLHPGDIPARMMLAEAFGLDESLDGRQGALDAIAQLKHVPDSAPQASKARAKEGAMRILLLQQPIQAEERLRRAIELDAGNYEACYLLWKLLDMTGRSHLTESLFWRVYELGPSEGRAGLLREWYLAEFSPGSENAPLDRKMGFLEEDENPGVLIDLKRFYRFLAAEPGSAVASSAIARLYLREGMRREAREILEDVRPLERAYENPYYVATQIEVFLEFGEFEEARDWLNRWPAPYSGYEHWKWKAVVLDEVEHDDQAAVAAYDEALAVWPGTENWRLMHRKAHCLTRLGRIGEADEVRARGQAIQQLMEPEIHAELRKGLAHLDDPDELSKVANYYRKLNRHREFELWDEYRRRRSNVRGQL